MLDSMVMSLMSLEHQGLQPVKFQGKGTPNESIMSLTMPPIKKVSSPQKRTVRNVPCTFWVVF